uniref:Sushi domain-containing protein n=1 Tax=Heterorhabditis bacteriophora TaxID=37862 RepID=A0A1I7XEQ3_HETBA
MNQSEIDIMFTTGVGIRVEESHGLLNVIVSLPQTYNETDVRAWDYTEEPYFWETTTVRPIFGFNKCATYYRTVGLLGTLNGDAWDDLTTPNCNEIRTVYPQTEADSRNIYFEFGEKCEVILQPKNDVNVIFKLIPGRLDQNLHIPSLFQSEHKPIYDPLSFADIRYMPVFDPWLRSNYTNWEDLVFSKEEVKVMCQGVPACEFDFMLSGRREDALETLAFEKKFNNIKKGEIMLQSCGPLTKNKGVIKYPPGNNYLHGVTVTFTCRPEYFLHGDQQRTCINGSWTPGWWPWCRERTEETALKWMTGILSSTAIVLAIVFIFIWCSIEGRRRQKEFIKRRKYGKPASSFRPSTGVSPHSILQEPSTICATIMPPDSHSLQSPNDNLIRPKIALRFNGENSGRCVQRND